VKNKMTSNNKNEKKTHKKMSPLTAGTIGAGLGVLAGATAVALSDKNTRKKLGKKLTELEEKAGESFESAKHKVEELRGEATDQVKRLSKKSKKS
jgi:hypothetical protein